MLIQVEKRDAREFTFDFDGEEREAIGDVALLRYPRAARLSTLNIFLEVRDESDSDGTYDQVLRIRIGEDVDNGRSIELVARHSNADGFHLDQLVSVVAPASIEKKENNTSMLERCAICGDHFEAELGLWPFIAGTWNPVCMACCNLIEEQGEKASM